MQGNNDDDDLMEATAKGNEQAFNRLVQRHTPKLYAVVRRYTGSAEDTDEIVQEAFWKAWQISPTWEQGRAQFSTWLYRVAINRAVDYRRKENRRLEIKMAILPDRAGPDVGSEKSLQDKQTLAIIRAAIDELPDKQRLALLLSTHKSKTNAEIANIMSCSEGAVEQLLVRARRRLREVHRSIS